MFNAHTISTFQKRNLDLLDHKPHTDFEHQLQKALAEAETQDEKRKEAMVAMQSVTILQNAYATKVNGQLHAQEEESEKKRRRVKRFDGTSAKLLTGDDFFAQAVEAEEKAEKEANEKEARKSRRETHMAAIAEWKRQEEKRKEHNTEVRQKYHKAIKKWEEERDRAKAERQHAAWTKPKMGKLEKMTARPKIGETADSEDEGSNEEEDDEMSASD